MKVNKQRQILERAKEAGYFDVLMVEWGDAENRNLHDVAATQEIFSSVYELLGCVPDIDVLTDLIWNQHELPGNRDVVEYALSAPSDVKT